MADRAGGSSRQSIAKSMNAGRPKILHVMHFDKFVAPFIDFIEEHFADLDRHLFFCFGDEARYPVRRRPNTRLQSDFASGPRAYLALAREMNRADKIILHGLFYDRVVQLLALQPWVLKKCYWRIWGGDLYSYALAERDWTWRWRELFRRFVIRRFGHLLAFVEGDVELARRWYGARGEYHECLMYGSGLDQEYPDAPRRDGPINILVGNSADPSNEHLEILQQLVRHKDENIRIYAPLSYGDPRHALRVAEEGSRIFGEKFVPLTEFMPFDEYLRFLGTIDVAIFNHRRQQGLGNILALLRSGKKVYLRPEVTPWAMFERAGVKLYDSANIDLSPMEEAVRARNREIIRRNFSERNAVEQLRKVFDGASAGGRTALG